MQQMSALNACIWLEYIVTCSVMYGTRVMFTLLQFVSCLSFLLQFSTIDFAIV